jgi:protein phosphatase PTC1
MTGDLGQSLPLPGGPSTFGLDRPNTVPVGAAAEDQLEGINLSYAHVATDPAEVQRIKKAGGQVFLGRVNGSLAVSRALGDHSFKRSGVTALPYQQKIPLTKDQKFLIIGCDGVWDVMDTQEAVTFISNMKDANKMAKRLVDIAIDRGTTDNVSAMVIRLNE